MYSRFSLHPIQGHSNLQGGEANPAVQCAGKFKIHLSVLRVLGSGEKGGGVGAGAGGLSPFKLP